MNSHSPLPSGATEDKGVEPNETSMQPFEFFGADQASRPSIIVSICSSNSCPLKSVWSKVKHPSSTLFRSDCKPKALKDLIEKRGFVALGCKVSSQQPEQHLDIEPVSTDSGIGVTATKPSESSANTYEIRWRQRKLVMPPLAGKQPHCPWLQNGKAKTSKEHVLRQTRPSMLFSSCWCLLHRLQIVCTPPSS